MGKGGEGVGLAGENLAADYLEEKGYRIVARRVRFRRGELDLVARRGAEWVFVEVKARTGASYGTAVDGLTPEKARRMTRAVTEYVQLHRLENSPIRCDLIAVDFSSDGSPAIEHYPAAIPMME